MNEIIKKTPWSDTQKSPEDHELLSIRGVSPAKYSPRTDGEPSGEISDLTSTATVDAPAYEEAKRIANGGLPNWHTIEQSRNES